MKLEIQVPAEYVSSRKPYTALVDIVHSEVPLLISRQTLTYMSDRLDFAGNASKLPDWATLSLISTGSGNLQLTADPVPTTTEANLTFGIISIYSRIGTRGDRR